MHTFIIIQIVQNFNEEAIGEPMNVIVTMNKLLLKSEMEEEQIKDCMVE